MLVKLLFTAVTLGADAAGRPALLPGRRQVPVICVRVALLFSTACILSLGFLIASVVPTARFAQPIGTFILYPMVGVSGLFVPVERCRRGCQIVSQMLPLTYAVSLLKGIWQGDGVVGARRRRRGAGR